MIQEMDIILVNYNSTDCLLDCLESVYNDLNGMRATVWVVDNASLDDIERITNRFPSVCLIRNRRNRGFGAAVNQALNRSRAPFVVLLNPDSRVMAGFFQPILAYMDKTPSTAIVGPRILNEDGSVQGSARTFPTPMTAFFGRSSLLSRLFPRNALTRANVRTIGSDGIQPKAVDWVSGACMVVRREAIEKTGGFDERFFMYWEDADWCRRMRNGGWEITYYPIAEVIHRVGVSSGKRAFGSLFEFHKSVYRLFEKYNPALPLILKILILAGLLARFCLIAAVIWVQQTQTAHDGKRNSAARSLE